jgi:hypothetical protein
MAMLCAVECHGTATVTRTQNGYFHDVILIGNPFSRRNIHGPYPA